jgi:hypothetical protein
MSFDGRLLGGIGVLAAVVETGNFARAAEALGLIPKVMFFDRCEPSRALR